MLTSIPINERHVLYISRFIWRLPESVFGTHHYFVQFQLQTSRCRHDEPNRTKRDVWLWIMANGFNHIKQCSKHQLHWKKSHDSITSTLRCHKSFCFWFYFCCVASPSCVDYLRTNAFDNSVSSASSNWPDESILNGNLVCRIPQICTTKVNVRSTHHSVVYSCCSKRANLLIRNFTVMIHLATL